jgi:hypothetical protein
MQIYFNGFVTICCYVGFHLYFSLIHSHLTYCPTIISCFTTQNLNKLFLVLKKSIRTISQQNYNAHTAPLFRELNILPLHSQLQFSKALLMHSIIYNYSPKSFKGIWTTNREQTQIYELQNNDQLTLPHPRIELFKRSPLYTLPTATAYFQNYTKRKTFV